MLLADLSLLSDQPPPVIYICRPSSGPADDSKVRHSHCQQTEGTIPSQRQKFGWDWKTFS